MSGRRVVRTVAALSVLVTTGACQTQRSARPVPTTTTTTVPLAPGAVGLAAAPSSDQRSVEVTIGAPVGATEMQLGFDPAFTTGAWTAVAARAVLPAIDAGYQTVFGRFRGTDGKPVGDLLLAAVTIDRSVAAATASAGGGAHQVGEVGAVAPDVLSLFVESGRVNRGALVKYDVAAPADGDEIVDGDGGRKIVRRGGDNWALQLAEGSPWVRPYDTVAGSPIDGIKLDDASGFKVSSIDDAAFANGSSPSSVSRITRPTGLARTSAGDVTTTSNQVFLRLPHPLRAGSTYSVTLPGRQIDPVVFHFDPATSRSPAVHVDQVGFAPGDPVKVAFLSAWTGAGGGLTFDPPPAFTVVDTTTGAVAAQGAATRRSVPADGELHRGDLTGSPVYELDFSSLNRPGGYRVCVAGIGCSFDFRIDADSTWMHATVQVARAMFHQRSGVALGLPNTTITRPRPFNPADGARDVYQSTLSLLSAGGQSNPTRYDELAKASTQQVVPEAWGGHLDAGDWDRNIDHLRYLRAAIDLVELYPEKFAHLNLDIPESGDAIPDLIDEGLWDLDMFKRLQLPDGGIRGGIEEAADPPEGTTSWTDYQKVWVYAPDPRSSYQYAGVAAEAALVLAPYDAGRARGYADSATKAFTWAEAHRSEAPADAAESMSTERLIAVAALYRLTGEAHYQDVFVADGPFAAGPVVPLGCLDASVCDAAWIYARTDRPDLNAAVKANVLDSFRKNADTLVELADTTAYGWGLEHPYVPLVWGLGPATPKITGLTRAYALFHDERYRSTAIRAAAFSLGGNPLDAVFVTGLGSRPARNPLIVDVTNGGLPVWPGIPLYGMHQLSGGDYWVTQYFLQPAGTTPPGVEVPYLWEWFDLPNVAMFNEFTVYQSHAVALFGFGSLAAAGAPSPG